MDLATYYLLQSSCNLDDIERALSEKQDGNTPRYVPTEPFEFTDELGTSQLMRGIAYTRQEPRQAPSWYELIHALTEESFSDRLNSSSHSGIVLVQCAGRVWGISFGYSYRDVEELPVEARFGRITISNALDDTDALRGFVAQTFGRNAKVRIESTNRDGPLDRLSFLEQSNRLRKLRARVTYGEQELTVEGGTGLKFIRPEEENQLIDILHQLLVWWNNGEELRPEIADKDPVSEITDKRRIDEYALQYEDALLNGPDDGFYLSLDQTEYWTAKSYGFKIGPKRVSDLSIPDTDVFVNQARQYLDQEYDNHSLRVVFDLQESSPDRKLRDVLSYERPQLPGESFVAVYDEGRWWEYRSSWVSRINTRYLHHLNASYEHVNVVSRKLTKYSGNDYQTRDPEGEWLLEQSQANQGQVLHVESNIRINNARSPVELADLYLPDWILLSAKRGDDLKRIDEVATQVEASARMLVREPEYRDKALELFRKKGIPITFENRTKIVLGCVTIVHNPSLSIRAKERICHFFETIHDFNFTPIWVFVDAS